MARLDSGFSRFCSFARPNLQGRVQLIDAGANGFIGRWWKPFGAAGKQPGRSMVLLPADPKTPNAAQGGIRRCFSPPLRRRIFLNDLDQVARIVADESN